MPTSILVDTREHYKEVIAQKIASIRGEQPTRMKLEVGDYYVGTDEYSCIVERKQLNDLIHSMSSDLSTKLARMHELADLPILLVEGHPSFDATTGQISRKEGTQYTPTRMSITSYHGYLTSLLLKSIPVIHTAGLQESIWWLAHLPDYLAKPYHHPLWYDKTDSRTRLLALWQSFPGIGYNLALEIATRYSLGEVVDYPDKLLDVPGIGGVKLDKITRFLELKLK